MTRKKLLNTKKLSVGMPRVFCSETRSRLAALKKMIKNGNQVVEDMTASLRMLREPGMNAFQVSSILRENEMHIKNIFDKCSDLVIREFKIANNPEYSVILAYMDGMVKQELIEEAVIKKLISIPAGYPYHPASKDYAQYLFGIRPEDMYQDMNKVVDAILNSNLVLFIDGVNTALTISLKNPPGRNVEEPTTEVSVRGSREGFTETLRTNTGLLRKKIKNANLKMESYVIGRQTKTDIVICYLANIASERIVNEVKERIAKIDLDAVLDSNYIGEYITDSTLFLFPTIFRTEKPDVVAGKLLEGRIAIIVDGSPAVLTVPCLFVEFLQTSEDYYLHIIPATINRWLRFFLFFLTITLPGVYTALLTFHQELIPDAFVP
ncbi:spore germination protein, partial [Propionispora sp. 2/2-37]|uniref:spore germination protein n=1 Tax=Propionispora sp. 2/2-37 TaxID=1677858 RepID=UPI000B071E99